MDPFSGLGRRTLDAQPLNIHIFQGQTLGSLGKRLGAMSREWGKETGGPLKGNHRLDGFSPSFSFPATIPYGDTSPGSFPHCLHLSHQQEGTRQCNSPVGWFFSVHLAVAQKTGTKMEPWSVCPCLVLSHTHFSFPPSLEAIGVLGELPLQCQAQALKQ